MKIFSALLFLFLAACAAHSPAQPGREASRSHWLRPYALVNKYSAASGPTSISTTALRDPAGAELILTEFSTASPEQADALARERAAQILSIYDQHKDNYYPVMKETITCPEKYQVRQESVERSGTAVHLYFMYANSRNTLGACTDDLAKRRAAIAFLRCGPKLLEVEKYVPLAEWGEQDLSELRSVDCLF